ncbi:hypothetical protein BGX27_002425 [Mortierella sp. AM989]|nr:hypothetical protein BGX27_002425 [Mortierella sp. AM989]
MHFAEHHSRGDWDDHTDTNMQHQPARSPYYRDQYENCRESDYHDSYSSMRYYSGNSYHSGNPKQGTYMVREPYDEYYGPGVIRGDRLDRNGDIRHDIHSSSIHEIPMDKQRHNSISSNTSSNSSSSANKHPCKFPTCGWSFKRFEHLKRHMLVHTKERPFICAFQGCEKSFSRSDNFSAHLRTHTKKSIHIRKFDRQLMTDPMGFVPLHQSIGRAEGSGIGAGPHSARMMGGGIGSKHSGYPDYTTPYSSPAVAAKHNGSAPEEFSNDLADHANHGATPAFSNRTPPRDSDYEGFKSSPPTTPRSPHISLNRPQYSPSGKHPLDISGESPADSILLKSEVLSTAQIFKENMAKVQPDLKAVSNGPEDTHLHNYRNVKTEFFHRNENKRDSEHDSCDSHCHQNRELYAHSDFRSPSPPLSSTRGRYVSEDYHYHKAMLSSSHGEPNPNPNGESPAQSTRLTSSHESSNGFAPHFVPLDDRPIRRRHGSMQGDDEDTQEVKKYKPDCYKSIPVRNPPDEYFRMGLMEGDLPDDRYTSGPYARNHRRTASGFSLRSPRGSQPMTSPRAHLNMLKHISVK